MWVDFGKSTLATRRLDANGIKLRRRATVPRCPSMIRCTRTVTGRAAALPPRAIQTTQQWRACCRRSTTVRPLICATGKAGQAPPEPCQTIDRRGTNRAMRQTRTGFRQCARLSARCALKSTRCHSPAPRCSSGAPAADFSTPSSRQSTGPGTDTGARGSYLSPSSVPSSEGGLFWRA